MRKLLIIGIILAALVGLFFYFGFYTYFIKTEINEEIMETPEPTPQTEVLAMGEFGEVDFVHKGSGQAKLMEVNGQMILRLENFEVTNGPDLYVYLSDSENPTNKIEGLGKYVNLGPLKASSGNQNYMVPDEANGLRTVIIWCKRFSVLFSFAIMK